MLCALPRRISTVKLRATTRLEELQGVVARTLSSFLECGRALLEIREQHLYRPYGTFERYCQERWGFSAHHGSRILRSIAVVQNLEDADLALPENLSEGLLRPLSKLSPPLQSACWRLVSRITERPSRVTVSRIVRVVEGAIHEANGHDATQSSTHTKDVFLPSVYKLATNDFSPQSVIGRITDRKQAQKCILACGAVIARCREIVCELKRQYPGIEL